MRHIIFVFFLCIATHCTATETENKAPSPAPALSEQVCLKNQSITINGQRLEYEVHAGTMNVRLENSSDTGGLSFIAYFKKDASPDGSRRRPLAFCFNGGPGSSSVWLHMGFLGPKIVHIADGVASSLPAGYKDNPETLLSICDLVFIDPISTGYSTVTKQEKAKDFYGVEEDLLSFADFVRLFLTKFNRWESPKLLIGESYGTLRAVGLTYLLQDRYFIDINGLILISLFLDLQTVDNSFSQDLPCITFLPTYAAVAKFHNELSPELTRLSTKELVEKAKNFGIHSYAPALIQGDTLPDSTKEELAQELQKFTSLKKETFLQNGLRITSETFLNEFLNNKNRIVGMYDGSLTIHRVPEESPALHPAMFYPDPSFYQMTGSFAAAFHDYLINDLHWTKDEPYILLNYDVRPWNWTIRSRPAPGLGYLSLMQDFRIAIARNPQLKTFVAGGFYDLVTPYFAQEYSLTHLCLPKNMQDRVTIRGYESGHMMYLNAASRKSLRSDLEKFVTSVIIPKQVEESDFR